MGSWDGIERRKNNHDGVLPECVEVFKRLEGKIDDLITRANKINGRYEKHIDESIEYREKVVKHETTLTSICALKRWWWGAVFTIILSVISCAVIWGQTYKQVSINTDRLTIIEKLHPRQ